MDIRISIKDCACDPTVVTKNTLSEVEYKKKNMLYSPPQKDAHKSQSNHGKRKPPAPQPQRQKRSPPTTENQKRMMKDLNQASKNQADLGMIHNSNRILQKQNQILEDNQRTLHQIVKRSSGNSDSRPEDDSARNQLRQQLQNVTKQLEEIKKVRDEIVSVGQQVRNALDQSRGGHGQPIRVPKEISEMNSNLRNLTEVSHHHLQGLENLQALKGLQNFNVQGYQQAVNSLKQQIIKYQKESEDIERQLNIRAAKLEKLEIPKNFDKELVEPYQRHLKEKCDKINLHDIKDAIYEKIGHFDYGRFENDTFEIMNDAKGYLADFRIVCKEHQIQIPTVKIDMKQLKDLDLKLPSILEQYKSRRGISFKENKPQEDNKQRQTANLHDRQADTRNKKGVARQSPANRRNQLKEIITKPIDLAKNVPYVRKDKQASKTILQTGQDQDRRQLENRMKKADAFNKKEDDDFEKYLENRAREELETLYQEKRNKLKKMEHDLHGQYQEPVHITLDLKERDFLEREALPRRQQNMEDRRRSLQREEWQEQERSRIQEELERERENSKEKNQHGFKREQAKDLGKQALKNRLKQLLGKEDKAIPQPGLVIGANQDRPQMPIPQAEQGGANVGNIAEGFVSLINNALTQINANLAKGIQKRIENRPINISEEARGNRKSPARRIPLPRLQQFIPPPTFNMNMNIVQTRKIPVAEQKIVKKDYSHLKLQANNDDLCISDLSKDEEEDD